METAFCGITKLETIKLVLSIKINQFYGEMY